jgi:hypothetical protein
MAADIIKGRRELGMVVNTYNPCYSGGRDWGKLSRPYLSQVPVAHGCNPSYSGGRDQEDHGISPAR